jgi:hypothetical protein
VTPQQLSLLRQDFAVLNAALKDVQAILANRRIEPEVKYDAGQPRAARGTPNGGQWTATGAGTSSKPRPPPPPAKRSPPPAIVGSFPRPTLRTPLPVIAGSVAIQRAAGTYAAEVSGQAKTPFLHIPHSLPATGSARFSPANRTRNPPSPRILPDHHDPVDRQCDVNLTNELRQCRRDASRYGRANRTERPILGICRATAMTRYSECLKGGGIHAIRTPRYTGHNYTGG